jgi:type II secretory pathway component GspD/PulD (secretin)
VFSALLLLGLGLTAGLGGGPSVATAAPAQEEKKLELSAKQAAEKEEAERRRIQEDKEQQEREEADRLAIEQEAKETGEDIEVVAERWAKRRAEEAERAATAKKLELIRQQEVAKQEAAAKAAREKRAADAIKRREALRIKREATAAAAAEPAPAAGRAPAAGDEVGEGDEALNEPDVTGEEAEGGLQPDGTRSPARVTRPRPGVPVSPDDRRRKISETLNRANSRLTPEQKAELESRLEQSRSLNGEMAEPAGVAQEPTPAQPGHSGPRPVTIEEDPTYDGAAEVDLEAAMQAEAGQEPEPQVPVRAAAPPERPRPVRTNPGSSPSAARNPARTPVTDAQAEDNGEPDATQAAAYDTTVSPEDREYSFSIKNGTYAQLIDGFSRQTGLPVLGTPPDGEVSFVSTQKMTFREALSKIRILLFKSSPYEPSWLRYKKADGYLEVARIVDLYKELEPWQMFRSVEDFLAADLPDDELAFVVYNPASVTTAVLDQVNLMMPDYMRNTRIPDTNNITILALVRDINRYLELVAFFHDAIKQDPRVREKIEVQFILPTVAVEKLRMLMDLDGNAGGTPSRVTGQPAKRGVPEPLAPIPEPPTMLLPDDDQQMILARAMPHKLVEIREVLAFIDVDSSSGPTPPVVIPVQNAEVNQLVETIRLVLGASETQPIANPTKPARQRPGKTAAAPARSVRAADVNMIPYPPTNSIIVIAPEEGVERVRELVERFDVVNPPTRIELTGADADTAAAHLAQLFAAQGPTPPTITPDPSGGALWVVGTPRQIGQIEDYLEFVDLPPTAVELHVYHPTNQRPSFLANMLIEYQGEAATAAQAAPGAKPAPARARNTRNRAATRGARRTSQPVTPAKFTPNDEANILYVWCSEEEWTQFEPLLQQLDGISSPETNLVRVEVVHISPEEAVPQLGELLSIFQEAGATQIRHSVTDGAILFSGATETQLDAIRRVLAEIDRPVELIQRTFALKHADPDTMIQIIQTFVGTPTDGGRARNMPAPRQRGGAADKDGAGQVVMTTTLASDLTVLRMGANLVVRTTPAKMRDVEAAVEQFDIPQPETQVTRTYDFPPGSNVEDVASTLRMVFGGSTTGAVKSTRGAVPTPAGGGPLFIPQTIAHRLIVIADEAVLPQIEELMDVLRADSATEQIVTDFIPVLYADPADIVEMIEPLLRIKIKTLVTEGAIEDPSVASEAAAVAAGAKRTGGPAAAGRSSEGLHLMPDPRNKRIVIAAPQVVIDEAARLVASFDLPREGAPSLKRVALQNAEPVDVVSAIRGLMGKPTKVAPAGRKIEGKPGTAASSGDGGFSPDEDFTIVEAPGGGAVLLWGVEKDILNAEELIARIDGDDGAGRIQVFQLAKSDVADMAELIMHVVDPPDAKGARAPAKAGADEEEDFYSTSKTYVGKSVLIKTDQIASTMLVSAPPAKMHRIEQIIEQFEGKPITEVVQDTKTWVPKPERPKMLYPLENKTAFDAMNDLEMVLEAVWTPADNVPEVDYIPFQDTLIVKYYDEERFGEVEEIIRKYVDLPDPKDKEKTRKSFALPAGISAADAIRWIRENYPDAKINEVDVGQPPTFDEPERLRPRSKNVTRADSPRAEQPPANPCVVPRSMIAGLEVLLVAAPAQNEEPEPEGDVPAGEPSEIEMAAIRELMAQQPQPPPADGTGLAGGIFSWPFGGGGSSSKTGSLKGAEVTIYNDPASGMLVVEAPRSALDTLETDLKDIEKELGKEAKPDIRVYRVRYIDVYSAAELLDQVINAAVREQAAAMRQQQQAQAAAARAAAANAARNAARNAQQNPQGGNQRGEERGGGDQKGQEGQAQPGQVPQVPQMQMMSGVTIVPNPRDRSLILKASTRDYPQILELLSIIDQPQPIKYEMRVYRLAKLNAVDVEPAIKEMLGLDQPTARPAAPAAAAGGAAAGRRRTASSGGPQALPQEIMQTPVGGGDELGVFPSDITIWSSEASNTITAMAPESALDYIGKLIDELEAQDVPERVTRHFELKSADPAGVAEYLGTLFADAAPGGRAAAGRRRPAATGSLTAPSFLPYPLLGLVTVQATIEDMEKIAEVVTMLDEATGDTQYETVKVPFTGADVMAATLTQMFGDGGGARGGARGAAAVGAAVKFIGAEGSDTLFYVVPPKLKDQVLAAINEIETEKEKSAPLHIIVLEHAKPSDVVAAVESAFGMASRGRTTRGRGAGAGSGKFQIAANDATKRVFLQAQDEHTKNEVDSLVRSLDRPGEIGFDFRIYPLQYANARAVYGTLNTLVTNYIRSLRGGSGAIEPFSVEVDDKSNSLIVLGSATVFEFLEANLPKIDNPLNKASEPAYFMVGLKVARAQDVANSINNLWRQRQLPPGQTAPQVEANAQLNVLIVRATPEQIEEIRNQFINPLEEYTPPQLQTETITLQHAHPEGVADSINRIFQDKQEATRRLGSQGGSPLESTVVVTPDVNTKQIIVQASAGNMELIRARIAELDRPDVALGDIIEPRVYPIEFADPNSVVNVITQWAQARTQGTRGDRTVASRDQVRAVVEGGTQSVVVTASASNHVIIAEMIESIDVERKLSQKLEVVQLLHASAEDVARKLNEMYSATRQRNRQGQQPVTITANVRNNSLIIRGSDKDIAEIKETIAGFDVEASIDTERTTEVYALRYADPNSINVVLTNMFRWDRSTPVSPSEQVTCAVDNGTRSVVVTASSKNHGVIRRIIEQVDVESSVMKTTFVRKLQHAGAEELAQTLSRFYQNRRRSGAGDQPVQISADAGTNSLLILANQEEKDEVMQLIDTMDVPPEVGRQRLMRSFKLAYSEPWSVQEAINNMFRSVTRNPRDLVIAVPEWGSNSVIVSASPENMQQIEELVRQLDQTGSSSKDVHVVTVEHADASAVARALDAIYVRSRPQTRGAEQPITISEIPGSKTILVKASTADLERIKASVAELDLESFGAGSEIRVVQLIKSNAEEIQRALESSLSRTPSSGRGGGQLVGDVRVSALPSSNALVISGVKEEVDRLEAIAKDMDDKGTIGGEPVFIALERANASQLLPKLEQMFVQQAGARGRGASQQPPVIVVDDATNGLIVKATPSDLAAIRSAVAMFDSPDRPEDPSPIRIIQVRSGINVTELAEMLSASFEESLSATRGEASRGQARQSVSIRADRRTNSLIVSGTPSLFDEVEKAVRQYEESGPPGGERSIILQPRNNSAESLAALIEQLQNRSSGSTSGSSRPRSTTSRPAGGRPRN